MFDRPKPIGFPGYTVTQPSCAAPTCRKRPQAPGFTSYAPYWS